MSNQKRVDESETVFLWSWRNKVANQEWPDAIKRGRLLTVKGAQRKKNQEKKGNQV